MSSRRRRPEHDGRSRPLSDLEKQLFAALLSADFPGRDALAKQVAVASVRELDGNGSLEFGPSPEVRAEVARRIPVEAEVADSDGTMIHVLLHVVNGFAKELEIYREDSGPLQRAIAPEDLRLLIL